MNKCLARDEQFEKVLRISKWVYALTGVCLAAWGALHGNLYRCLMGLGTLLLFPVMWGMYSIFHWKRGCQLEFWIFAFAFLSCTLGGAADFYLLINGFDKITHALSGTFVAMLALALYMTLERKRPVHEQNAATAACFVFFASMAVAGLFEIGEFMLAPIVARDLQRVAATGVTDTITDMIVCLIGTLLFIPLVVRFYHGKYDPLTGAVDAFLYKNRLCGRDEEPAFLGCAGRRQAEEE